MAKELTIRIPINNMSNHVDFGLRTKHFVFDSDLKCYKKDYPSTDITGLSRDIEYLVKNQVPSIVSIHIL